MNKLSSIIPVIAAFGIIASSASAQAGECSDTDAWTPGTAYVGGALVANDSGIYKCKGFPYNGWCGIVAYEPGTPLGAFAWDFVETCTVSGDVCACETLSECGTWSQGSIAAGTQVYDAGTDTIYECNAWPASGWCGQAGYEPGGDQPSVEDAWWKQAWTVVDDCSI